MEPKERLLTAMTGGEVDRLPWAPFLAYYWESQPVEVQQRGQLRWLQDLGADPLLRGSHKLFMRKEKDCSIRVEQAGKRKVTTYETPVGKLMETHVYSPHANTWFLVEHPVKTMEDFRVLAYINEHLKILPDLDGFEKDHQALGGAGLYVPVIGSEHKTCFQSLVEHWVGTEELAYALADFPEVVEETLQAMRLNALKTVEISVQSSAEAFIFWEDSSTTNISPDMFQRYAAPEINQWGRMVHDAGKILIHHACGHLRALIPLMGQTQIDVIESISPPPTGNIELWEARDMLPDPISLVGGIEPTVFMNSSLRELEDYVCKLSDKMGKTNFVMANSDSCPPSVEAAKFYLVTDIVRRRR